MQFIYKDSSKIVDFIHILYNSDLHFNESLLLNSRALGLSMGPNANAVIILISTIFIYFKYHPSEVISKYLRYLSILSGMISLFLSQSQTGIIAFIIILLYLIIILFIRKPIFSLLTLLVFIIPSIIFISTSPILDKLSDKNNGLYYLSTLFEQGTERSSYQLRIEKRNAMIDFALKKPAYSLIGWGKDFFGDDSSATDNEHLYISLIYGPLIWSLLILAAFWYGLKYTLLYLKNKNKSELLTPCIILSWVIIALPAAFITYPEALILSALFINCDYE